ncbi:E3 ubiquitin-protein ligase NEURL3 isoform X2 [Manis pentadactyla]|uniref:E3 ubiquitin-protein ligase NEURL3 isoform X2 n=1 Tax=Manis pentadactyla TaxID=143292 RepID=UPI0018741B02|nr:E3 ubiquitin-protein ligase NEURL3 isoform X2 [Manis pentadactyla]
MGAWLSSPAEAEAPRETLRFHAKAKGAQVQLDALRCTARRRSTFHDGIVFSHRPVQPDERVALRVLWHEDCWCGGLRVGFTRLDPARVPALLLPPFLCPDLEQLSPTWAAVLPRHWVFPGNVIRFWVNRSGWLFANINAGPQLLLRKGVLTGAPLWAVMDVYGTTKAIQLLGTVALKTMCHSCWSLSPRTPNLAGLEWAHALFACLLGDFHAHAGNTEGLHLGNSRKTERRCLKEGQFGKESLQPTKSLLG